MTFTGYIYKITGSCGLVYIGSTTDIGNRMSNHNIGNASNSKLLKKPLHFKIIDTREYKLNKTLRLVEQFFLDNNKTVNQQRAYRNKNSNIYFLQEKERCKIYYQNNKDKVRETKRIYREKNKEKNLEYHRKYYQNNREKVLERTSKYNQKNKEKINRKVKCECGCILTNNCLSRHKKSKKHINLLTSQK